MVKVNKDNSLIRTVGRRKTAAARVLLTIGTGKVTINGKELEKYFPIAIWSDKVVQPLKLVSRENGLDISVKVVGGGVNSQAEAVRHGVARALVKWNDELKPVLKAEGYLTRDSRMKERKKFGHTKARRGHQWRKR